MKLRLLVLFVLALTLVFFASTVTADDVKFPPVADLEPQVDAYVKELDKVLEDATDDFAGNVDALKRDANTLILITLSLGMMPEDNKYKESAAGIIAAAQGMNDVKKLDDAKKVVEAIKASLAVKSDAKLEWSKVAAMEPVMKLAVSKINTKTNTFARSDRYLKRGVENVAFGTAALSVFFQGLLPNYDETEKPEAKDQWVKFSTEFHNRALVANQAVHDFDSGKVDFDTFKKAYTEMKEECDVCHEVFVAGGVTVE